MFNTNTKEGKIYYFTFSAVRKEVARRSLASSESWKTRMEGAEQELEEHRDTQQSVTAGKARV